MVRKPQHRTMGKATEALKAAYGLPHAVRTPEPELLAAIQKKYATPYGMTLEELERRCGILHMKKIVGEVVRQEHEEGVDPLSQRVERLERLIEKQQRQIDALDRRTRLLWKFVLEEPLDDSFTSKLMQLGTDELMLLSEMNGEYT